MEEPSSNFGEGYYQILKILLVGNTVSKKRTLLQKFVGDESINDVTTLGLDYKLKDVVLNGKKYKLQLWDTAGQERFRSVTASYYRGSHGALIVCSIFEDTSFLNLQYWLDEIKNYAPSRYNMILVAITSSQSPDEVPAVSLEAVKRFAEDKQLQLLECDLGQPDDVSKVLTTLVSNIVTNVSRSSVDDDSIMLEPHKPSSTCSC